MYDNPFWENIYGKEEEEKQVELSRATLEIFPAFSLEFS
jgi:hypothetical protein